MRSKKDEIFFRGNPRTQSKTKTFGLKFEWDFEIRVLGIQERD